MCRAPLLLALLVGCFPRIEPDSSASRDAADADADSDTDTDADSDADTDADSDSDTDTDTDADTDADTDWPDHSGDTVAMVFWSTLESYDGSASVYGLGYPVEPGAFELWELWGDRLGGCDGSSPVETTTWGSSLSVVDSTGDRFTLALDDGAYTYSSEDTGDYVGGRSYGLASPAWTGGPSFETGTFFTGPSAFDIYTPDVDSGYGILDTYADLDVTWGGGGGDFVLVWLYGYTYESTLYCVADDTGSFTIDKSYLSRFGFLETVQVSVARFSVSEHVLHHDNGVVLGAGMYQYTGLVTAY